MDPCLNQLVTHEGIIKSHLDHRHYRGIELPNKMKIMLISDPSCDKSSASLSVAAGAMNSPRDLPGLAHFCEHMLFMGTLKYPQENDFGDYLSKNGGSSNASTFLDFTAYFFSVSPSRFYDALDRFAQFFIAPIMAESSTEREVNAVNSENDKNYSDDSRRLHRIECETADPTHPYWIFTTGNRDSLWKYPKERGVNIRDELIQFHKDLYSSNGMTAAIIGRETLDELQNMAVSLFSEIPNKNVPIPSWSKNPYGPGQLGKLLQVVPLKELRGLNVTFPICLPDISKYYKSGCVEYILNLLGYKGSGSLYSLLKGKNWIQGMSVYDSNHADESAVDPARGFSFFRVKFELTMEGFVHVNHLMMHLFQYIQLIKEHGIMKWIWEEMRHLRAVQFRYKDKDDPESLVLDLAIHMQMFVYPFKDLLSLGYLFTEFKPDVIETILKEMTPEKCRMTLISKEFEGKTHHVEQWYNGEYNIGPIDPILLKEWKHCPIIYNGELALPLENPFIPNEFELKPSEETTPQNIIPKKLNTKTHLSTAWFLHDNEFKLPKAIVWLEIYSPLPNQNSINANLNMLMVKAVRDSLEEDSYPASLAGLNYKLTDTIYGQEVRVEGYDHKLPLLLYKILENICNFRLSEARFEVLKEHHARTLRNWEDENPYLHSINYLTYVLMEKSWRKSDLLNVLKEVTYERLMEYAKDFIAKIKLEWLLYGNLTDSDAFEIVNDGERIFEKATISVEALIPIRVGQIEIPKGKHFLFKSQHPSHKSSCTAVFLQTGPVSLRSNLILELIHFIIREPCFDTLRTKESLGYIVFSRVRRESGTQGLMIVVQSDRAPSFVESRIMSFLKNMEVKLEEMSLEEFTQIRDALIQKKAEKPEKLGKRADLIIAEITNLEFNFERQEKELSELVTISRAQTVGFFNEFLSPKFPERIKQMVIHIESKKQKSGIIPGEFMEKYENINDAQEWKRQQNVYPFTNKS